MTRFLFFLIFAFPAFAQDEGDLMKRLEALRTPLERPAEASPPPEEIVVSPVEIEKPSQENLSQKDIAVSTMTVQFSGDLPVLAEDQKAQMIELALQLDGNARIELHSLARISGHTASQDRRLALDRGLAIRTALQEAGVPISSVDILPRRAQGEENTVQVYIKPL